MPLPAVAELARHCAARLHAPERLSTRRRFCKSSNRCSTHCAHRLPPARCVHSPAISRSSRRELIESGRIAATSASMLRNLLQLLTEDGVLQQIGESMAVAHRGDAARAGGDLAKFDYRLSGICVAHRSGGCGRTAPRGTASHGHRDNVTKAGHADTVSAWADACTQQEAAEVAEALADVVRGAVAAQAAPSRLRVLRFVGASPAEGPALVPLLDADRCDVVIGTATQAPFDDLRGRWPTIDTLHVRSLIWIGTRRRAAPRGRSRRWLRHRRASEREWPTRPTLRAGLPNARRLLLRRRPAGHAREARIARDRSHLRPGAALVGNGPSSARLNGAIALAALRRPGAAC